MWPVNCSQGRKLRSASASARMLTMKGRSFAGAVFIAAMLSTPSISSAANRIAKGPYLTGLSESGVDVRFELEESAPAAIEVRRDSDTVSAARTFRDAPAKLHCVRANDLAPGARYSYTVRVAGNPAANGHFVIPLPPPAAGASLKFLVYGDDRTDPAAHQAVVRSLQATDSDFLVNT